MRPLLGRAGVSTEAVDLPGHGGRAGETDPAAFTLDATLEGVHGAVDRAGGTLSRAPTLVGYSMGGRIALQYACARPRRISRLVLESASPGLARAREREARARADEELAAWIEEHGIEAFSARWESLPLFASQRALPPQQRSSERARRLANVPASLAASLRGVGTGVLPSLWDRLPELDIPVLLVAGARDPRFVGVAERMVDVLPTATVRIVEGAGHRVHLERPEAWAEAVATFVLG